MATTSVTAIEGAGILAAFLVGATVFIVGGLVGEKEEKSRRKWILPLLRDHDKEGLPSLAKFQLLLWTGIVSFAVLWVAFVRLFSGADALFPQLPTTLLGIVGVGIIATPVSGHESTMRYVPLMAKFKETRSRTQEVQTLRNRWRSMLLEPRPVAPTPAAAPNPPPNPASNPELKYVPSLTRLQMLLWTLVGVTIYALVLLSFMLGPAVVAATETLSVPDLDQIFLALMGISQVGFIGGKVAGM